MPKLQRKVISLSVSPSQQSGIGILASPSVRYRWSQIIPVVPTYMPLGPGKLFLFYFLKLALKK
jgi:hypothetical protein